MAVARNAADEFFETIIFMSAQNYVQKYVSEYVTKAYPDTEDFVIGDDGKPKKDANGKAITVKRPNIIGEAVAGAANVVVMGAIMYVIRYEEKFMERFFVLVNGAITFIVADGKAFFNKVKSKVLSKRGYGATKLSEGLNDSKAERIELAKLVSDRADSVLQGRSNQHHSSSTYGTSVSALDAAVNREALNHKIGNSMVQAQLQMLMFKLFSKNFTATDNALIKKVMQNAGATPSSNVTADDLNKIADFMFVKDVAGNITGLSELFLQMTMGMNLHNKVPKNG
jgi:hypothetical protein